MLFYGMQLVVFVLINIKSIWTKFRETISKEMIYLYNFHVVSVNGKKGVNIACPFFQLVILLRICPHPIQSRSECVLHSVYIMRQISISFRASVSTDIPIRHCHCMLNQEDYTCHVSADDGAGQQNYNHQTRRRQGIQCPGVAHGTIIEDNASF